MQHTSGKAQTNLEMVGLQAVLFVAHLVLRRIRQQALINNIRIEPPGLQADIMLTNFQMPIDMTMQEPIFSMILVSNLHCAFKHATYQGPGELNQLTSKTN